ncbi:MAG TPA: FecR family protein [Sphingobacteriaceae bacterium]
MEDNKNRLQRLLTSQEWNDEDRLWLLNYLDNSDNNELHTLALEQYGSDLSELENSELQNLLDRKASEEILAHLHEKFNDQPAKKLFRLNRWAVAATVVLAVLSLSLLYYSNQSVETKIARNTPVHSVDIAPGSNKALLTLADGSTIVLDNISDGEITKQGNTSVIKSNDMLAYNNAKSLALNTNIQPTYNTITTPRGGQYKVILPDNTIVWLNAASSLRFPTKFSGKERKVDLTGEAYFEVAKNKAMPFKVSANNTQVEVLGTHFNVMAYTDENSINTTLLEGSVKIVKNNDHVLLVPGQQAQVKNDIKVLDADVQEAIAWKNGLFLFKEAQLETILKQIARWYDVEIEFEGNLPDEKFRAEVSRNVNLSQVLKILELSGVNFTLKEGRKIIVKP